MGLLIVTNLWKTWRIRFCKWGSNESKRATELGGGPIRPFSLLYAVDRTHAPTHDRTAFGRRVDVGSSGVGWAWWRRRLWVPQWRHGNAWVRSADWHQVNSGGWTQRPSLCSFTEHTAYSIHSALPSYCTKSKHRTRQHLYKQKVTSCTYNI